MFPESKDIIIKHFVTLIKECDVNVLKEMLVKQKVFTQKEMDSIFSTEDARHNKRVFFFNIQRKEQRAFHILVQLLRETKQHDIANILEPKLTDCKPFVLPTYENQWDEAADSIDVPTFINDSKTPVNIKVKLSTQFHDTVAHNQGIEFYSCRSKKRGRVLIINNYDFSAAKKTYRNGASVDLSNLKKLFTQMGGWEIDVYENQTAEQMKSVVKQFSQHKGSDKFDVCFVIIMSHGNEDPETGETVINGIDGYKVPVSYILNEFTNQHCRVYRGKPKVFLFQVCRGEALDFAISHRTETDSQSRSAEEPEKILNNINIRDAEDMLIGYATLQGRKAHRDPFRGSWYIELICESFMNKSHDTSVQNLLTVVDQGLRRRMSEQHSMQTAEYLNKGFKILYLNPGIYSEGGVMKSYG